VSPLGVLLPPDPAIAHALHAPGLVCRLTAVTTRAGEESYANYAHFEPVWNVKPPARSPPPPPAQTPNSAYVAEVAYMKTPLPNGTSYTAEVSR